ncbi:hypothetical protein [Pseudonocardia spinosispora]|uniref:hypothetical protein n=1 Tax=Pseudonocardia spinosispora TaxID=103441 RepID=UPI0004230001|nr:hypothetical protein [Pseudonocardia spinosispora]
MTALQLRPVSSLSQTHQLLVGQQLDGWPEVEVADDKGVTVRDAAVRYTVEGDAARFAAEAGRTDTIDRSTGVRGRVTAMNLYGVSAGTAVVVVTLPDAPDAGSLRYEVNVPS